MPDNQPDETPLYGVEIDPPDESQWSGGESPYDAENAPETQDTEAAESDSERAPRSITIPGYVRTGSEATKWALGVTSWHPSGMCQQFTRSAFNVGSYYGSAIAAWNGANRKHRTDNPMSVPRGVPIFWSGGSRGFGHAAVSLGNGMCRSTDWPNFYSVGTARISDIHNAWGHNFLGWTEDINEVTVWQPALPVVWAGNIARAARREERAPQGRRIKQAVAAEVGKGNMQLNHSVLGGGFKTQYAKLQTKYLRDVNAAVTRVAVDGVPGVNSLTWLGDRHGFNVKS